MKNEKLTLQQSFWTITLATITTWVLIAGIVYLVL
jgi:hypothetical protein|nr:MAG TPA: hypothetical protein [Caudoviricetes sp.]